MIPGPVTTRQEFRARSAELESILSCLTAHDAPRHVQVLGPNGSGRSSLLLTAAGCLASEKSFMTVRWHPLEDDLNSFASVSRSLLSAIVEASPHDNQLTRWRERTWLGSTRTVDGDDLLTSGLVFARSNDTDSIDSHVVVSDLRSLRELSATSEGFVIFVDDADQLVEDTTLFEQVVDVCATAGWSLAISGTPKISSFMAEAGSPLLRMFRTINLGRLPFSEIKSLILREELDEFIGADGPDLIFPIWLIASSSPLIANFAVKAMVEELRETGGTKLEVSQSVLRRLLTELAGRLGSAEELNRIAHLPHDELHKSLEVVLFDSLPIRELAAARVFGFTSGSANRLNRSATVEKIDNEEELLRSDLDVLEKKGLVELDATGRHFKMRGGDLARIYYITSARELLADGAPSTISIPSSGRALVGEGLARDLLASTASKISGARQLLDWTRPVEQDFTRIPHVRKIVRAVETGGTVDLGPLRNWTADDALIGHALEVVAGEKLDLALMSCTFKPGQVEFEHCEIWAVDAGLEDKTLADCLLAASEDLHDYFEMSDCQYAGCESLVITGEKKEAFTGAALDIQLQQVLFREYEAGNYPAAIAAGQARVKGIKQFNPERQFELSEELNRLGFIELSSGDFAAATDLFLEALELAGDPKPWLIHWNLAISSICSDNREAAIKHLETGLGYLDEGTAANLMLRCWSPSKPNSKLMLGAIGDSELKELFEAQLSIVRASENEDEFAFVERKLRESEATAVERFADACL